MANRRVGRNILGMASPGRQFALGVGKGDGSERQCLADCGSVSVISKCGYAGGLALVADGTRLDRLADLAAAAEVGDCQLCQQMVG